MIHSVHDRCTKKILASLFANAWGSFKLNIEQTGATWWVGKPLNRVLLSSTSILKNVVHGKRSGLFIMMVYHAFSYHVNAYLIFTHTRARTLGSSPLKGLIGKWNLEWKFEKYAFFVWKVWLDCQMGFWNKMDPLDFLFLAGRKVEQKTREVFIIKISICIRCSSNH